MFAVTNHTNAPVACPHNEWAFYANTDLGQAMYSMLLSAAAQCLSVTVHGANDCTAWPDRERPFWITIDYPSVAIAALYMTYQSALKKDKK